MIVSQVAQDILTEVQVKIFDDNVAPKMLRSALPTGASNLIRIVKYNS